MKIKAGLVLIVLSSLMVFSACTDFSNKDEEGQGELVLKSYQVPERSAKEINETINELLGWRYGNPLKEYPPTGKARLTPDGQLMVNAPESFHRGMKDFLTRVQNAAPEPSSTVEVNYWMVAGRKANAHSNLEEFDRIKPALETIQNNQGNMEFKLLDHAMGTSSGQGTMAVLHGAFFEINYSLYANSDGTIVIRPRITNIPILLENSNYKTFGIVETQIETRSGELVVLAQESQPFQGLSIFETQKEGEKKIEIVSVYYIVTATIK